jgi:hypothetical protein
MHSFSVDNNFENNFLMKNLELLFFCSFFLFTPQCELDAEDFKKKEFSGDGNDKELPRRKLGRRKEVGKERMRMVWRRRQTPPGTPQGSEGHGVLILHFPEC